MKVQPDKVFKRDGADISVDVSIPFTQVCPVLFYHQLVFLLSCGVHVLQPIYTSTYFCVLFGYSDEHGSSSGVGGSWALGITHSNL